MPHAMRDEDAVLRTTSAVAKRDSGNVLRDIAVIKKRDANNVLRTVFSALAASASPPLVQGFGGGGTITTESATVTVVGGSEPVTYEWQAETGWTILSPTSATTAFQISGVSTGDTVTQDFTCIVTDAGGAEAETNAITASATNINSEPTL